MFCRAQRIAGGRVHDDYTGAGGSGLVDVVGTDTGADNGLQVAVAVEYVGCELHAAAADRSVKLVERVAQLVAFQSGADFVFETFCRFE